MNKITNIISIILFSYFISFIVGKIIVNFFNKRNFNQRLSIYLSVRHKDKKNTPTMGGLIFVISTLLTFILLLTLIFGKLTELF